jgi:hypothetical protein
MLRDGCDGLQKPVTPVTNHARNGPLGVACLAVTGLVTKPSPDREPSMPTAAPLIELPLRGHR